MNRRNVLTGVGITLSVPLVGCLNTAIDDNESANDATIIENEDDEGASNAASKYEDGGNDQSTCSFNVELVEDPPDDVSIVSAEEEQLTDVDIIERILEEAIDPEEHHETVTRPSGEYEQFTVIPDSTNEFEEAKAALEPFPRYDTSDYPSGVYLSPDTEETVVAIADQCQT